MPDEITFKIGETVMLSSGGHLMTILAVDNDGVTCAWSAKGDTKTKIFPAAALTKSDKPMTLEQLVAASYEKKA
jgi:uncharacterized protein YodC (DUF2158 family)